MFGAKEQKYSFFSKDATVSSVCKFVKDQERCFDGVVPFTGKYEIRPDGIYFEIDENHPAFVNK